MRPAWNNTLAVGALLAMAALLGLRESDSFNAVNERQQALALYDADHNGRLSDAEREAMRRDRTGAQGNQEGYGFRRAFTLPPEIVEQYDRDHDGKLNDEEELTAREGIRQRWNAARKEYDANGNGRLDLAELETLEQAILDGKVTGLPIFMLNSGRRGPRGDTQEQARNLRQFDLDHDGRLSETELRAARAFLGLREPPTDLSR